MRVSEIKMRNVFTSMLLVVGLVGSFNAFAADVEAGKAASAVCAGCHGANGNSAVGSFPKLAGQGAKYIVKQMNDINSGARPVVEMTGILDGLSAQDFNNIAAFYQSQVMSGGQAKKELVEKGESCKECCGMYRLSWAYRSRC
jgi:cytochrome c553